MRILLVGNYALDSQASMLRYADMLCRHMALRGHEVEIIQPQPVVGNLVAQPALRKWLGYIDKYVFFPMKLRLRAGRFDLVHVCDHSNSMYLPHTGRCPASITCHDLLAIWSARGHYPQQTISFSGRLQQRWILKHLASASDVVCVSANTAHELGALTGRAGQRVVVIANALNFDCAAATQESLLRMRNKLDIAADERYLLHIGGNHWYKNRPGVLRIFQMLLERLRDRGAPALRMVMAGGQFTQKMRDMVTSNLPEGSVIEVVNPSDEDLGRLYSGATALLFPSLYEGFGWPLIEAQSCGCPVITSNRSPMTEVAGSAALYIDPADESAAADLIVENLDSLELLREAGFRNAQRFDAGVIIPAYERFFAGVAGAASSADVNPATRANEVRPEDFRDL